jgi:hypothetical protein
MENRLKQVQDLRDKIHSELVQEATVRSCVDGNPSDGVLRLKLPYVLQDGREVDSICCESGLLLGNDKVIRYRDVILEDLVQIHNLFASKQYSFELNPIV